MAGHGGRRPGAGRKKGETTKRTREIAEKALKRGIAPLEYMLKVMRNPKNEKARRDDMAKAAAPYIHPRLATHEVMGKGGGPIGVEVKSAVTVYLPNNSRRVAPG